MYVNKILYASTKPKKPVEVFNEFYVAKSLGAKEYNKHEFVRANEYYMKALTFINDDMDILLRICNCYLRVGNMKLAWKFHKKAKRLYPDTVRILLNEINLLYEIGDYEGSLKLSNYARNLYDNDHVFLVSAQKALDRINYEVISEEVFYRNMVMERRYLNGNAYHRLGGMTRNQIDWSEGIRTYLGSKRLLDGKKMLAKMINDRNEAYINKYYNVIVKTLECNDFTSARKNTELLTDFMKRKRYKKMSKVLNYVYSFFGAHQLLVFQDIKEWDEKANHARVMYFLGQISIDDPYEMDKTIYGADIVHSKITIGRSKRKLKCVTHKMERIYLLLQLSKLYLRKGNRKNLLKSQRYASQCMELANAIQNPWWYLSALVVSSSGGFQLNQSKRHEDKLELVIETGYKLDLPELSKFAAKLLNITLGIDWPESLPPKCFPERYLRLVNDPGAYEIMSYVVAHTAKPPELKDSKKQDFRQLVNCLRKKYSDDSIDGYPEENRWMSQLKLTKSTNVPEDPPPPETQEPTPPPETQQPTPPPETQQPTPPPETQQPTPPPHRPRRRRAGREY